MSKLKPIHDENTKRMLELPPWAFASLREAYADGLDLSVPLSRRELFTAILTWNGIIGFETNILETLSSLYGVKLQ